MADEHKLRQNLPFAANQTSRNAKAVQDAKEAFADGDERRGQELLDRVVSSSGSVEKAIRNVHEINKKNK